MRFLILLQVFLLSALALPAQTATFNWSDPLSLNPPFSPPTSENRYGPYIGDAIFSSPDGTILDIDDDNVKELSQKARFLYGYLTGEVELRVYPSSWITITAPEGKSIRSITFTGAKADDNYLDYSDSEGEFKGNTWTAFGKSTRTVEFSISTTINCTSTTVVLGDYDSVNEIESDDINASRWYTLDGLLLSQPPTGPGLYISISKEKASKILIR